MELLIMFYFMKLQKIPITTKIDYLKKHFLKINFDSLNILDAGTGKTSANFLTSLKPKKLSCVTFIGDVRKGNPVNEILSASKNKDYKLFYGDLSDAKLFKKASFDYVLADYLLGELNINKIKNTFFNLYSWLKPDGKILFIDREFYEEYRPEVNYISMGNIQGEPKLQKRSDRDIYESLDLFLMTTKNILLLSKNERSFDYPSEWVHLWLVDAGFKEIKYSFFDIEENIGENFYKEIEWIKERIKNLKNKDLEIGLLKELKKIENEFKRRKIKDSDTFLRRCFFFDAKK